MLRKLCCSVALFALVSTVVHANEPQSIENVIKPFTAEYSILRKSDPVGTGIRQLEYLDDNTARYSYETNIEWLIFSDERKESSLVKLDKDHVTPVHYKYTREGTGRDKKYEWQYDVSNNSATNLKDKKEINVEFPTNIQDSLSYHLQHRINLINNPTQKHYVYPVIKTSGSIKNYVYQYDDKEELMLPYGLVNTIRLKREVVEKERVTYAWFAPELNYLLVKLYQTKGGVEQFEVQLKSVKFDDNKIVPAAN
ncbi:DUF3108 domain-containing protein [Colwelliaceae bacterium 6471]